MDENTAIGELHVKIKVSVEVTDSSEKEKRDPTYKNLEPPPNN